MVRYAAFDNFMWLWLVAALAVVIGYGEWRRRRALEAFAGDSPVARIGPLPGQWLVWTRALCLLGSVALLIIALARPQWGKYWIDQRAMGRDIIVALDVSRSMLADDVTPSRLERAKADIRDLVAAVEESGGHRLGLIAFAGSASLKCPLTQITSHVKLVLDGLDTRSVARGGSMIGDCIRTAVEAFGENTQNFRDLILITDGEDMESYPGEAAAAAHDAGITIYAIGLGDSEQGSRIPIIDQAGRRSFLEHDGPIVWSKMNSSLLRQVAQATGGLYVPAGTRAIELDRIFREVIEPKTKRQMEQTRRERMHERFQWFLLPAVLLLMLEMLLRTVRGSIPVQVRAAESGLQASPQPTGYRGRQTVLPSFMVLLALVAPPAQAAAQDARSLVIEGNRLYAAGKYDEAAQLYDRAAQMAPDSPVPLFNRAASLYQAGEFEAAAKLYDQARARAPLSLQQMINYAMGNCHLQQAMHSQSDPKQALEQANTATQFYRDSIPAKSQPANETAQAARHNLELAKRLIKQLEQQQQQQQEQQQQQGDQQPQDQQKSDQQRADKKDQSAPGQPQNQPGDEQKSSGDQQTQQQEGSEKEPQPRQTRDQEREMSAEEAADRLRAAVSRAQMARSRRLSEQRKQAPGRPVDKDW